MSGLRQSLEALARSPVLLIASDYDGTLAPLVSDPARAPPHRRAIGALRRLAGLPRTHAAIISGRALGDLAALSGAPEGVHLVGSHGREFDAGFAARLPPESVALRRRLEQELSRIAAAADGLCVEVKPASVALHYRNAEPQAAQTALEAALGGPARCRGVHTIHGKMVVELSVVPMSKGAALDAVRRRVGATGVVFIGDDLTDEDAFRRLLPGDLGVTVGEGQSAAPFRLASVGDVASLLAGLADLRADWLRGRDVTCPEDRSREPGAHPPPDRRH